MSNIVVQKFGGTSLADTDRFKAVAKIIKDTSEKGKKVVAVVSAMAGETQRLIDLAKEVQEIPDPREYDALISSGEQVSVALLAMTLRNEKYFFKADKDVIHCQRFRNKLFNACLKKVCKILSIRKMLAF